MVLMASAPALAEPSFAIREQKTWMIEGHLGYNGIGAGIGIFLPDDARLDINFSQNDFEQGSDSNTVYKVEYQMFTANSFYVSLGVNHRRAVYTDRIFWSEFHRFDADARAEIEATHAHFSIGNEWSFNKFFIGGEWFGLSTPLRWQYKTEYPTPALQSDIDRWNDDVDRAARRTHLIMPNLYVGFAF
ncbi:hypothetical protein [Oligoflexus tunisiensis]|uniref:hypothetical protein n=1 Tax=Oligoflexus tunisiensis TaxID=708132 RepID=UPI001C4035DE|nr:hypothetical protein [Oligoflexus tunisiensis]